MKVINILCVVALAFSMNCVAQQKQTPLQLSGIYPRLAYYNNEGECGTGAIVPGMEVCG